MLLWVCASRREATAAVELIRAAGVRIEVREVPPRVQGQWHWPSRYAVRAWTKDSEQERNLRKSLRELPPGDW